MPDEPAIESEPALGKRRWRRTHSRRFATAGRLRTARSVWSASDLSALFVRRETACGSWSQHMREPCGDIPWTFRTKTQECVIQSNDRASRNRTLTPNIVSTKHRQFRAIR